MRYKPEGYSTEENQRMLAEFETVIREMPAPEVFGQRLPDSRAWLGRAAAVLERWDITKIPRVGHALDQVRSSNIEQSQEGLNEVVTLLHQARHDLTMEIGGSTNVVVQAGMVFDYFEGIRRIVELAKSDLFFVDAYLDADVVARYLPAAAPTARIRLLAREKLATLLPAVDQYAAQFKRQVQVRSIAGFHDRYVFVDRVSCHQSGASFKEGAKYSPTTVTEVVDAFAAVLGIYERLWDAARVERP